MSDSIILSDAFRHRELVVPPDSEDDKPIDGYEIPKIYGALRLPTLILGCAVFSGFYNSEIHTQGQEAIRTVRLCLRYGIRAFDTSRYYGPSEYILGNILSSLRHEFPRHSYQIMTKCGRFGPNDFDYDPARIRQCVLESLERLRTTYLDVVYLHDVEFVASQVMPKLVGNHVTALDADADAYGLAEVDASNVRGEGDQKILDAIAELQKLKQEGIIKNVGITGYPLPTLLRLAILIKSTSSLEPVDLILSYSHLTLQNSTFNMFAPHFYERAQVKQLLAGSPLSMGLLTLNTPSWHPAPDAMKVAVVDAFKVAPDLPNLALGYTARQTATKTPLVVGLSNVTEVHECVKVWREVHEHRCSEGRFQREKAVIQLFERSQYLDWSWQSP